MKVLLSKNRIHILIWVAMLIYLPFSYAVHARYFLKGSSPIIYQQALPESTTRIKSLVLAAAPDQNTMAVGGWAFLLKEADQAGFDRFVVLSSGTEIYIFPVTSLKRADIQDKFKHMGIDLMNSGFGVQISKEQIRRGEYRLGILFRSKSQDISLYQEADFTVSRTPNYLKVEKTK